MSAGIAALYGPLHGGANEAVLRMLDEIGDRQNVPEFIEHVKAGHGRLMGSATASTRATTRARS